MGLDHARTTGAHSWLHLGANIGAADTRLMVRTGEPESMERVRPACEPHVPAAVYNVTEAPAGEAGVVALYGGQFASFIGAGFPLFHSINDRWPQACDFDAMAAAARAALNILHSV